MRNNLPERILNFVRTNEGAWTVAEISDGIMAHNSDVQAALHKLDDEGWVAMRNGLYQASARALS